MFISRKKTTNLQTEFYPLQFERKDLIHITLKKNSIFVIEYPRENFKEEFKIRDSAANHELENFEHESEQ